MPPTWGLWLIVLLLMVVLCLVYIGVCAMAEFGRRGPAAIAPAAGGPSLAA